ncbi:ferrous iron transport protein A [Aeoliella sp. ICT_H6.2]|uniref:Ferrous iron transport protein A n=1 Tax=Aeoliella straminimaris TaxID=2954799 RepID=A0A9X2JJS5_9BACT|nr:FeoA family protein [Aeoliella straminimaris]MCO6047113.1 ferrous iron transport protein A [Aeoliella straminimaris]
MPPTSTQPARLSEAPAGGVFRVVRVDAESQDADRLKAMGVCRGRRLSLIQNGDPLIVCVVGSRVGMSSRLADTVYVELECLPSPPSEA